MFDLSEISKFFTVLRVNVTIVGTCFIWSGCTTASDRHTLISSVCRTPLSQNKLSPCPPITNWRPPPPGKLACRPTTCARFRNRVSAVTDTGIVRPRPAVRYRVTPYRQNGQAVVGIRFERTTKYERKTCRKAIPRCGRLWTSARYRGVQVMVANVRV